MIGELLFKIKGRLTGSILNADEYKIEYSIAQDGKFKDIEITILGIFRTIPVDKNVTYGEGQGDNNYQGWQRYCNI